MATHAQRYPSLDLPRPWRAAAPLLVLAVLALLLEIDSRLPWLAGLVGALCFSTAGAVRSLQSRRELAAVRRTADRLIVHAPLARDPSELIRWRSLELTAPEHRERLACELGHLLAQLDERRLPSASPLRRPAARGQRDLLDRLDRRLRDGRPVTARGVLLAEDLLRSPSSPLFNDASPAVLPRVLARVLGALEP